jgi:hypothetical protein
MNHRAAPQRFAQVLVPLAPSPRGRAALAAAIDLAAAVGARLEGLFVEDPRLARLSALPFAREVESLTAAARGLGEADIERAFRVEAAHLRQLLVEQAQRARIEFTFEVTRGEVEAEVAARAADLTVLLGTAGSTARAGARAPASRSRVMALYDATDAAVRGLAAAARLAHATAGELLILVPQGDARAAAEATAKARAWLEGEGVAGTALVLPATTSALRWAVRLHHGRMLTIPAPAMTALALDLAALADEPACAIVLVR